MDINQVELYKLLYVLEANRLGVELNQSFQDIGSIQDVYKAISQYYFKENNVIENDERKLYEWAKQKARYPLLNKLLQTYINGFIQVEALKDDFVLNNFESLLNIMMDTFKIWSEKSNYTPTPLSKINRSTTHQFVQEFLIEVDPSLEWLAIYNEMLQNNRLIIFNDLNSDEQKQVLEKTYGTTNVCVHSEDTPFIVVTLKGDIADFIAIVHEFAHDINFYHNPKAYICGTLLETSSIFYEYYALRFLEKKGYSKEEIKTIHNDRLADIFYLSEQIHILCYYLQKYLETGEIKEEQELKGAKDIIHTALTVFSDEVKETMLKVNASIFDPKKSTYNRCDKCIEQMLIHPQYLYQYYPYIVGNYLAIQGMKQIQQGNNILPKIKELTENLHAINPSIFFKTVGCEVVDIEENIKQFNKRPSI